MKKNKKFISICLIAFALTFAFAGGGGKGGTKNGIEEESPTKNCETKTIPLVLFEGNIITDIQNKVQGRENNFKAVQPTANIFNGLQSKSAPSMYNDKHLNYCYITITSSTCKSYGNGGTKTFIWDSGNNGNANDSTMNIEIPKEGMFTITIDFHESCGQYYRNGPKRAMWVHQQNYNPTSIISVSSWRLNRVSDC